MKNNCVYHAVYCCFFSIGSDRTKKELILLTHQAESDFIFFRGQWIRSFSESLQKSILFHRAGNEIGHIPFFFVKGTNAEGTIRSSLTKLKGFPVTSETHRIGNRNPLSGFTDMDSIRIFFCPKGEERANIMFICVWGWK